jgi:hypothetical protein
MASAVDFRVISKASEPPPNGRATDAAPAYREIRYEHSRNLPGILEHLGTSLWVSTYQAGKLIVVGSRQGALALSFHNFEQAMGIAVRRDRLAVGTGSRVWFLRSAPHIAPRLEPAGRAIAHGNQGHKQEARNWYDQAVGWIDQQRSRDEELRRLRGEAAALLGLPEPTAPARKEAPRPPNGQRASTDSAAVLAARSTMAGLAPLPPATASGPQATAYGWLIDVAPTSGGVFTALVHQGESNKTNREAGLGA